MTGRGRYLWRRTGRSNSILFGIHTMESANWRRCSPRMQKKYEMEYLVERYPGEKVFRVWVPDDPNENPYVYSQYVDSTV